MHVVSNEAGPNEAGEVATQAPAHAHTPRWTIVAPLLAFLAGIVAEFVFHGDIAGWMALAAVPVLLAAVFATVHHAETIAHRIGQPFGSIVLALAVTVIEVALIISVMLTAPAGESTIARDTVFAAIMIVLNGIVGLSLFVGGITHHTQSFQGTSASGALGVLGTLAVLCLVLPNYTFAQPGPVYAPVQLAFVAGLSLMLYAMFLYVQLARHKDDFLEMGLGDDDAPPVGKRAFAVACGLLPLALIGVVLLAETLAHSAEFVIEEAGLPLALIGVGIALVVLLPEAVAALRAARANRLQTSLNLALGSALASLCLTVPTVAIISLILGQTLVLGLDAKLTVLLVLTLFMSALSLALGRTTVLQGGIHLVIFAAYLILVAVP